jgi:hypothetical protein
MIMVISTRVSGTGIQLSFVEQENGTGFLPHTYVGVLPRRHSPD